MQLKPLMSALLWASVRIRSLSLIISDSSGRRASILFLEQALVQRRFLVRRAAWRAGVMSWYEFWEGTEGVVGWTSVGAETLGRAWGRGGYLLRSGRSVW